MDNPLAPYEGGGPYVFVSYSHRDDRRVSSELRWLNGNAIHLWYDEGISAGSDWRDAIGDAIAGSALCLFFVSRHSVQSEHCIREVKFALDNDIPVLPVYLESAELPPGLAMALGNLQAILKFSLSRKRFEARLIESLRAALDLEHAEIEPQRSGHWGMVVAVGLAIALSGLGFLMFSERTPEPDATTGEVSIAVVPFGSAGGVSRGSAAEALTVSVANALVSAGSVPVVSLNSSRRLLDRPDAEIAARLDVSHLIRGIVQASDGELRVFVSLVEGRSGEVLWSDDFRGAGSELFELQDRVDRGVLRAAADRLALPHTPTLAAVTSTNPIAYDLYLEASNLDKRFPAGNRKAIEMLEQAVSLEPGFVDAWVELAFAYWQGNATPRVKKQRVKAVLEEALARQPRHGAARALLGTIVARCEYEWARGFDLLQSAHDDYPFDARVQALWAHHLGSIRHPDAPQASLVAYQLDPLSGAAVEDYARSLFVLGRQLDALSVRENYLEMAVGEHAPDPDVVGMLIQVGRVEEAERQLSSLEATAGASYPDVRMLRMQLALQRKDFDTAASIEAELLERRKNEDVPFHIGSPATLAERYAQAIEQRATQIIFLLLLGKPPSIAEADWVRFRKLVRADQIRTPIVVNYRQRTAAEIDELMASELAVAPGELAGFAGTYQAERFPPLTFEAGDGHLILVLGPHDQRLEQRLIHTGPGVYVLLVAKGYRYEFGDGTLVAYDGQIRRDYVKQ